MAAELSSRQYQKYLLYIVSFYRQKEDLKVYFELILSVVTIGVFVVFAIKPTLVTIGDIISKIDVEQKTSDALDVKIKNLGIAQADFTRQESKIKLLDQSIPVGPDISGFIRQTEGLINQENLSVTNLSVGTVNLIPTALNTEASIIITFTVAGNYQNLENLVKDFEKLRRPSLFSKTDFSSVDKSLNLTTSLQIPYLQ